MTFWQTIFLYGLSVVAFLWLAALLYIMVFTFRAIWSIGACPYCGSRNHNLASCPRWHMPPRPKHD